MRIAVPTHDIHRVTSCNRQNIKGGFSDFQNR